MLFFQVVSREASGQPLLAAHYRVDGHPFINPIQVKCSFSTSKVFMETLFDLRRLLLEIKTST